MTFSPTVFIVDDDPSILAIVRRRFYCNTSVGVVVADNLASARQMMDIGVKFDAVIADLAIPPDKQDPENNLQNGLDFLDLVRHRLPDVSQYVLSVWSDEHAYREQATERNLPIREWIQKFRFDSKESWNEIERHLYGRRLESAPNGISADEVYGEGSGFAELVRQRLKPIIRTYLQDLPEPYRVTRPIEVVARKEDGTWLADALHLGVLQPGTGDSLAEAIDELGFLIVAQYEQFKEADPTKIEGFAVEAYESIKAYISPSG